MPEVKSYVFSHPELAEVLLKKLDIHEGIWGLYLEFGFAAANVPQSADLNNLVPTALCFVNKIGIQKFDTASNLTVDAALVNPAKQARHSKK